MASKIKNEHVILFGLARAVGHLFVKLEGLYWIWLKIDRITVTWVLFRLNQFV